MERGVPTDVEGIPIVTRVVKRPSFSAEFLKNCKTVQLYSNHFKFKLQGREDIELWMWDIKFQPPLPADSRELRLEILAISKNELRKVFGRYVESADSLYTFQKPTTDLLILSGHKKFTLELHYSSRTHQISDLDKRGVNRAEILKILDHSIHMNFGQLGLKRFGKRNPLFYDPKDTKTISIMNDTFKLNIHQGIGACFDIYVGNQPRLMFYQNCAVVRGYSMLEEYDYFRFNQKMDHKEVLDKYIIGFIFTADYGNSRTYRIDGIDTKLNPESPFDDHSFPNYVEYYKKKYGVKILDKEQFLAYTIVYDKVVVEGKSKSVERKLYLVPELLKPTGLTEEIIQHSAAMRDVHAVTTLSPNERYNNMMRSLKSINKLSEKKALTAGQVTETSTNAIQTEVDLMSNVVQAYELRPPSIMVGKKRILKEDEVRGPQFIHEFYDGKCKIDKLVIIYTQEVAVDVSELEEKMAKAAVTAKVGLDPNPTLVELKNIKFMKPVQITDVMAKHQDAKMFLIVLSKRNLDQVYKQVKMYCHQNNKASQFFKNVKKANDLAVASKLLKQICAKLGFRPWVVQPPKEMQKLKRLTIGADVFHRNMHTSIASVVGVASSENGSDDFFCQTAEVKRKGDDIFAEFSSFVTELIRKQSSKPDLVVIFRDGVDEGRFDIVREKEIQPLLKKLHEEHGDAAPKVIFILVVKRVSDRFFKKQGDQMRNPQAGTFIVSDVCKDNRFDFFGITPQSGNGPICIKPIYYNVMFNNSNLSQDTILNYVNAETYCYYNWFGPIKLPAPLMYAQKLGLFNGSLQITSISGLAKTGKLGSERTSLPFL